MIYEATDGTVFSDRNAYRRYEMETRYTIHGKTSENFIKHSGSVNGQPFDIAECRDCEITILDHCDQVQIDDVVGCKIFIGASCGSIFLRGCRDCTFTMACKQFRTRDCENCSVNLYCMTEPIIEASWEMKFYCFHGAYPEHRKHMLKANLNPDQNLWDRIYDFSDTDKTGKNWSCSYKMTENGEGKNCCEPMEESTSNLSALFDVVGRIFRKAIEFTGVNLEGEAYKEATLKNEGEKHVNVKIKPSEMENDDKLSSQTNNNISSWLGEAYMVSDNFARTIFGWFTTSNSSSSTT